MCPGVFRRKSDKLRGKAGKYTIWWTDEHGHQRSRVAYTDRAKSLEWAHELEVQAGRVRAGLVSPADLARKEAASVPLADHLDAYAANITAKGGTSLHARQAAGALRRLFADLGADRLADLTGDRVQAALGRLHARRSPRTANYALVQCKAFCRWLVAGKKLPESPVAHLKAYSQSVGRRRQRRALTADEAARLVAAAASGPTVRVRLAKGVTVPLSGPDRAMLYRIALGTGYRADEIRHLTPECFRLDAAPPTISLRAEFTKDSKAAEQPIRRDLADRLRPWLEGKAPGQSVVPVPIKTAELVRKDCQLAGIEVKTAEGEIDFHGLRVTFVTMLIKAGVDIKTVQLLARHANPAITLSIYIKSTQEDKAGAVEKLPDLEGEG